MIAAHLAGIPVFVTGGIGGVHRGAETSMIQIPEWEKVHLSNKNTRSLLFDDSEKLSCNTILFKGAECKPRYTQDLCII